MPEERKLVTILFADVAGSTALGESLDPEDVRALMGRYYQHARAVVDSHGGTLEKFIGDSVMAVFGLPEAHGDDAERGLAAALSLRDAVRQDALLGSAFDLRMGVDTGEVVATTDASADDFLVSGDTVNLAARLQQAAQPGEVLAGERTAHAADAAFLFGEERLVEVKGRGDPVRVFPLDARRPARAVTRPPFVGRKQDLLQLELLRSRALEERRPQLVSVIAPAGTGKTRVIEEFLDRLDPEEGFRVATARCLPYGQTLTYWPLRGLLEEMLEGEACKQLVMDALVTGGNGREDASRLADLVLTTLGIESGGQTGSTGDREAIFNAWRLLVEAVSRDVPRILIFEDLHWASDSLLDLVEHVMHPRTQAPLLLVALSRPELLDRRPTWGGGRQSFTALALNPLNETQTQELVRRLAGEMPETVRDRIAERSGGNPFFVTELVRGLAERGLAVGAAGSGTHRVPLPDTVYGAVLARLDLLSSRERSVLQAAAVAGRAFRPAMVHAVLDEVGGAQSRKLSTSTQTVRAREDTQAAIDELLGRDLIVPADGGTFAFRHVLFRDVAYNTLPRADRVRMHAAVAKWLEAHAAERLDEFTELIAYHYREAVMLARQSAVPLELPIEPAQAVSFLERAGELASRAGAFEEATAHLRGAIGIAPSAEHARLYEKLGDCASFGDRGIEAYGEALKRWREEGAGRALDGARLLRKMLVIFMRWQGSVTVRPRYRELVQMRTEARELAESSGDEDELWRVRTADLFWAFWRGESSPEEVKEGMAVGLAAADYFERQQDWEFFNVALDGYASAAAFGGEHEAGLAAAQRRLSAPALSTLERGDAVNMLANVYVNCAEYRQAVTVIQEALRAMRPGEPIAHLGNGASLAAFAAVLAGFWDELGPLGAALGQAWEDLGRDPGAKFLRLGHFALLHVATARGDRPAADAAAAVLERLLEGDRYALDRALVAAYREEDAGPLLAAVGAGSRVQPYHWALGSFFLHEQGIPVPTPLRLSAITRGWRFDAAPFIPAMAEALERHDSARLAAAIDEAERHALIPHAARMQVVLAAMSHDPAPLLQAQPVLERLEDRLFLQRLRDVEGELSG